MALASWSTKRILMLWVGGLVLQALLIAAPVLVAMYLIDNRAELMRVEAEQQARWRAAELADSLSLERQRADARIAHSYAVTASGDTIFPLVHEPSGRPKSVAIAVGGEPAREMARYFSLILFGLIPTLLIVVTFAWFIARRRDAGPPPPMGAT